MLRILIILANLLALARPRFAGAGREEPVFDVIAFAATVGVVFTGLRSTAQVTKRLYEVERLD